MTEDDAKTKWCPFVRYGGAQGQHGNRGYPGSSMDSDIHTVTRCIGSACMAWRWDGAWPLPDDPPEIRSRYGGFCGLAGKP